MAIVVNISGKTLVVKEIKQKIPFDGKFYVLDDMYVYRYQKQLSVVPQIVLNRIDKEKEIIQKEKEKIELEKRRLENERKNYKILFDHASKENPKKKKEWENKIKNIKTFSRIDVLYSFHFDYNEKDSAIKRLKLSIDSLKNQNVNICIINTSNYCIKKELGYGFDYCHKPLNLDVYCKSKTINIGVKHLIKTPYFVLSDIDLIYPPTFIEQISKYTYYYCPVRVLFNNYNTNDGFIGTNFRSYESLDKTTITKGLAPGNGLIHLKSFKKIGGYDENYIGYGLEDADFNLRISYLCKYIVLDNKQVNTYHLFHENKHLTNRKMMDLYLQNMNYYQEKRKKLVEEIGSEEYNIYDGKKHLKMIRS